MVSCTTELHTSGVGERKIIGVYWLLSKPRFSEKLHLKWLKCHSLFSFGLYTYVYRFICPHMHVHISHSMLIHRYTEQSSVSTKEILQSSRPNKWAFLVFYLNSLMLIVNPKIFPGAHRSRKPFFKNTVSLRKSVLVLCLRLSSLSTYPRSLWFLGSPLTTFRLPPSFTA